ncbi:MAG: exodeoxyribonuclease large subunit [Pseudomonadota bacterium]|jgi:exodeoxyribonuclease VII large subunit
MPVGLILWTSFNSNNDFSRVSRMFHGQSQALSGAISVSELNRSVAGYLERGFPLVRVRGEIAQLSRPASGHLYFSLRDAAASVRAVMWRARLAAMDWLPKEGDQVEVTAVAGLYEPRGDFQLRVESLVRSGQGALYEAFLARKAKLAALGLFDDDRKRPMPDSITTVALVTSPGAAALRDVVVTLSKLAPRVRIRLYPSLVQGSEAPEQLRAQLVAADQDPQVDVIAMVRGGGSLEDLWAFNDEALAMAISTCAHPVIVGVGHESDVTIADLVADLRAATPTAAAQRIAQADQALLIRLAELNQQQAMSMRRQWAGAQQRLDLAAGRLRSPSDRLRQRWVRLGHSRELLIRAIRERLQRINARLAACQSQLTALDPHAVLNRGYALVLDEQSQVVTDARRVQRDQSLSVQLAKGLLDVRVQAAHPSGKPG